MQDLMMFRFAIIDCSMKKELCSSSRLVAFQQIKRNWLKHEDRLIHIKPTINSRPALSKIPTSRKENYTHSLDVELQNKALLKKLTDRIQSKQDLSMCSQASHLPRSTRKKYYEQYKIKYENEGLYRRLNHAKPIIDTERILNDRRATEKYINTISRFGYKNLRPNKTIMKFDFRNNELKYLSKRKIIINEKLQGEESGGKSRTREQEEKVIEMENEKFKNNEKLFQHFVRFKQINIDGRSVLLKINRGSQALLLQLKNPNEQQNFQGELQVKIPTRLFKERFKDELQNLIESLRFSQQQNMFIIV